MQQYSKAAGAGVGAALATVIMYIMSLANVQPTPEITAAVYLLCSVIGAYAAPKNSYE